MRLGIYLQVDSSLPSNGLKGSGGSSGSFMRHYLFPSGAHKDQVHVFCARTFFEVHKATVEASGMSGGLSGPFWENILNINFLKCMIREGMKWIPVLEWCDK